MTLDEEDDLALRRFLAGLRGRRERLGMSVRDLAGAAGFDSALVSRLERGKIANLTARTLMRVAQALGTSIIWPRPPDWP